MNSVSEYVEKARKNSGADSDRKVAQMLGLKGSAASMWRTGRTFPSDETMIRLAQVAGVDPYKALIDLNIWRSSGNVQAAYRKLAAMVNQQVVRGLVVLIAGLSALIINNSSAIAAPVAHRTQQEQFNTENDINIYYHTMRFIFF